MKGSKNKKKKLTQTSQPLINNNYLSEVVLLALKYMVYALLIYTLCQLIPPLVQLT